MALDVLAVAVESDQQRRRPGCIGRLDEIAAVSSRGYRVDGGGGADGGVRVGGHEAVF